MTPTSETSPPYLSAARIEDVCSYLVCVLVFVATAACFSIFSLADFKRHIGQQGRGGSTAVVPLNPGRRCRVSANEQGESPMNACFALHLHFVAVVLWVLKVFRLRSVHLASFAEQKMKFV